MTWSVRIKCEGTSAIFELVLRVDLMTCCRTKNSNAPQKSTYYWFARDVTAAMLVAKKKGISLLWDLDSIFMLIL